MKPKKVLIFAVLGAFLAGIVFMGGVFFASGNYWMDRVQANSEESAGSDTSSPPGVGASTIADIVEKTGPAVVKIETYVSTKSQSNNYFDDPLYQQFFGQFDYTPEQKVQQGVGTGFIISTDGYILTNEHVVSDAQEIQVSIADAKKPVSAKVIGSDEELDLAVLKIDAGEGLPTIKLGKSSSVNVGNWVIAIGNPYSLDHTVTVGVISAKGRPITVQDRNYRNLLQTDASINPGNSGGPLLNLQGEVIGINTAVGSEAQGIGFAIPSDTVSEVVDDLIKEGKVTRGWLGVEIQDVTQSIADNLGLEDLEGVLVRSVTSGGPAEKAGVEKEDIILSWNDSKVENTDQLLDYVSAEQSGEKVKLTVWRDKKTAELTVTLGER
jgi:Do/DeqQ family serine protease